MYLDADLQHRVHYVINCSSQYCWEYPVTVAECLLVSCLCCHCLGHDLSDNNWLLSCDVYGWCNITCVEQSNNIGQRNHDWPLNCPCTAVIFAMNEFAEKVFSKEARPSVSKAVIITKRTLSFGRDLGGFCVSQWQFYPDIFLGQSNTSHVCADAPCVALPRSPFAHTHTYTHTHAHGGCFSSVEQKRHGMRH